MRMPEFLDSSTKPGFRKPLSSVSATFSPFNHIHGDTKENKTRGFQRHNKPVWQNVPAASLKDVPVCGFFRSLGRVVWMFLEAKEAWRAPESPSSWHWKGTEAIYPAQRRWGRASSRGRLRWAFSVISSLYRVYVLGQSSSIIPKAQPHRHVCSLFSYFLMHSYM